MGGDKRKIGSRDDSKFSRLSGSEEDSVIDLNKKCRRKKMFGKMISRLLVILRQVRVVKEISTSSLELRK